MNKVELNTRSETVKNAISFIEKEHPYPRLMRNKSGSIILATHKEGSLTTGILVGFTEDATVSEKRMNLGRKFVDWEVGGELKDYDGEVEISLKNEISS